MQLLKFSLLCLALIVPAFAGAQDNCSHRGDLDVQYCDANKDMVADLPTDSKKLKSPNTLVFTFVPIEEPAVYEKAFKPFTDYLAQCTGKRVVFFQVQSNAAEIEAMRAGRLHVAGFSTGATPFAVNIAGAVPFALKGTEDKGVQGNHLVMIVKNDSPYKKLSDLKGKKVAHVSPSSNSGHLAPKALFPKEGLVPDTDYKIVFSGKHDQSILGVNSGDYDAAAVDENVVKRMADRGVIKKENFRVLYRSKMFPSTTFAYAHDLEPKFRDQLVKCFHDYRFPPELQKTFDGSDRFLPATYQKDWLLVREVADAAGEKFTRDAYEKEQSKAKDKEAKAKKQTKDEPVKLKQ